MKRLFLVLFSNLILCSYSFAQAKLLDVKSRKFKTSSGLKIIGQVGYMEVLENRSNPSSRKIKLKYVHLKSLSVNPSTPVVYLEGGGGVSTWEADSPKDLNDRFEILEVADLILLDRRGASDNSLTHVWEEEYPTDFFVSEESASQHYQQLAEAALDKFNKNKIDVAGYNIEEHATDVNDLMSLLGLDRYILFGFSYGTHIGMTVMKLYPNQVERAILVGADAPNQAFNFPRHLDEHVVKIGELVEQDSALNMSAGAFNSLVYSTMNKLKINPVTVTVKNPLTKKEMDLSVGGFGLALILRLDIDDANDIPVIPRLLHSINSGDYSILTFFVQKRMTFALGLPGQGINQQLASGAGDSRWSTITKEASESPFGNVVNFPFAAVKDHWISTELSFDPSIPLRTEIPTLFLTGSLDCRTPVEQVEETMLGFVNAAHVKVVNAGHEQAQWDADVANKIIPSFIKGENIESTTVYYSDLEFINVTGKVSGHPSIR
ncbi:MAG: alpha/beta hydrolase [Cyclobacteriaceae bacterium]